MTLKVRDEEDVIEDTLRYHFAQGVASFVVTDNGSTDRTPQILERWAEAGLVEVISEPGDDMRRSGHEWVTRMARAAAERHAADWVLNSDADELWWPVAGTIPQALSSIEDHYGTVVAPRAEFVARPETEGSVWDRLTIRESRSLLRPKAAHRALDDVWVLHHGQHDVSAGADFEEVWQRLRAPGRPVLRPFRRERPAEIEDRLVWAPSWPLRIFHFPVRSFEQYARRVALAARHGDWAKTRTRRRMSIALRSGQLRELYEGMVLGDDELERRLADGTHVVDERISRFMEHVPDPLDGAVDPAAVPRPAPGADELALESAQLAYDAMHVLSRTMRMHMVLEERQRDRLDALDGELRNALRRARRAERRPLPRLLSRVRKPLG